MAAQRPPHINQVMIAAADLENAEFERDRLAMACGAAIRLALADGHTLAQIAQAASMAEGDVRRLAEASPEVLAGSAELAVLPGLAGGDDAALIGLYPSVLDVVPFAVDPAREELVRDAPREPDAAL
ncbi:hypothetical protein [Arthrobacter sedimenti]|uniref:hypothetical protein n=1 Tax=Arthrobacter sedimenti TaxID=2694931 RepID=UPI000B35B8F4|nr:hypothetical protein [Arthrobacter sedimenti]OUM44923.1 hypothetical protein B8W73_02045 [Arthrobacter agilis]